MTVRVTIVVDWLLLLLMLRRLRVVLVGLGNWQAVMRQWVIGLRRLLMDLSMRMWMMRVTAVSGARVGGHFVEVGCVGEMSGDVDGKGREGKVRLKGYEPAQLNFGWTTSRRRR